MKTCSYCGKEYPDDAVVCKIDESPLGLAKPKPPVDSRHQTKKHQLTKQPITIACVLSIFGFSILSGLCGIGLISVVLGIFVNHNPRFKNNGDRLGFLADNMAIFMAAGIVGFIVGLVISLKVAKADPKTEEKIERKYVGLGGRVQIYLGAPIFIIAMIEKMLFEKLLSATGTETGTWIAFGIASTIFIIGVILYERISNYKFIIPIGIIGWMLTLLMFFWFGVLRAWH